MDSEADKKNFYPVDNQWELDFRRAFLQGSDFHVYTTASTIGRSFQGVSVHRSQSQWWILVAVAVTTLATLSVVGLGNSRRANDIPWVDHHATAAILNSVLPKPLPVTQPPATAPECTSTQLRFVSVSDLQWMQNRGVAIGFRNVSSRTCLARDTPRAVATLTNNRDIVATSLPLRFTLGDVANTPSGATVFVDISDPILCSSDPSGSLNGFPTYRNLLITRRGGQVTNVANQSFQFPCGMSVSPFFMVKPPVKYMPFPIASLQPSLALPTSVKDGSTLTYSVTLTNPLNRVVSFDPCPAYIQYALQGVNESQGVKSEYVLNCSTIHTIGPHAAVKYQMKMKLPSYTLLGKMEVFWDLVGPSTQVAHSTVQVK